MLSVSESIGIILGANIGTTIKAWIIASIGFNAQMGYIALPVIGITFPLLFSKNSTRKSWGGFFVGLSLLFISLDFLRYLFDSMHGNTALVNFLTHFSGFGFGSVLLFVLSGMIITALVQSSSATVALTIVMCANGWLSFELGAAMILGENIGTTVTANIAAIVANVYGKRTAFSHTLIKVIGVIWALIFFKWFLSCVDMLTTTMTDSSPLLEPKATPIGLVVFHSLFNIVNTIILIGFVPWIVKMVEWFIPPKSQTDEQFSLKYFGFQFSSSELIFLEAKKEIVSFALRGKKQFNRIPELLVEKDEHLFKQLFQVIIDQGKPWI